MYTFSSKLKTFSFVLMILGVLGIGYGFLTAPKDIQEVEKILGVPSYKDRVITQGSIYHVMTYGINTMGNYANQLNQTERWLVADYVMKLKNK